MTNRATPASAQHSAGLTLKPPRTLTPASAIPIANHANVPASVIGMIPPMSKSDQARSPIEIAARTASTTRSAFSRHARERPRASRAWRSANSGSSA